MAFIVDSALKAFGLQTDSVRVSAQFFIQQKNFDYIRTLPLVLTDIKSVCKEDFYHRLLNLIGENYTQIYGFDAPDFAPQKGLLYADNLIILPMPLSERNRFGFCDLYDIMQVLMGENGCQWDKAQTHKSIRTNAIEEAYELVNAIDNDDIENIREEAGDVILQGVFHSVIAEREGEFAASDVVSALCEKLVTRHTHIFGDVKAENAQQALAAWEKAKAKEKKHLSLEDKLKGVTFNLPALLKAQKVQKICAKQNFEFRDIADVYAKIEEETAEFKTACGEDKELEAGDLLFSVVNLLRKENIDAEVALLRATQKFAQRVAVVEKIASRPLSELTDAQLDLLWKEAKARGIEENISEN